MFRKNSDFEHSRSRHCFSSCCHTDSDNVKETFLVTPIAFLPAPSLAPPLVNIIRSWPSSLGTLRLTGLWFRVITPSFDLGYLFQNNYILTLAHGPCYRNTTRDAQTEY